jgi:tellurite resistance protein
MTNRIISRIPASFFGIVLGTIGLGNTWRVAHRIWSAPRIIGEVLEAVGALVWLALIIAFVGKWALAREQAQAELKHPVQCCFVGLIGVATMLVAGAATPYSRDVAIVLFLLGATFTVVFGVWRTGGMWQGGRDPAATTAVLYLPTVAGSFVTATMAATLGFADWARLAFGAGSLRAGDAGVWSVSSSDFAAPPAVVYAIAVHCLVLELHVRNQRPGYDGPSTAGARGDRCC